MARYDQIAGSVESRFNEATNYANEAWTATQGYLTELSNIRPPSFELGNLDISWSDLIIQPFGVIAPTKPELDLALPDIPVPEDTEDITVTPVEIPVFDIQEPNFLTPEVPDDELPDMDLEVPEISDIEIPNAPEYTIPEIPDINTDIVIPEPPEANIPLFNVETPEFELEAPGNSFVYSEGVYQSELFDAGKNWLLNQLGSGSTGLDLEVENALIDRFKYKLELEHRKRYEETLEFFSSRHMSLPPGALNGAIKNVQTEIGREVLNQLNEIMIMQGDLAQKNTHFVIEKAIGFETMALGHFNAVANRAFEVARYAQQAALETYNAKVAKLNLELQRYQTLASVYEIRIKAEGLRLEQYKVLLEGKKIQGDLQKLILEKYNLQLDSVKTLISLYATEMTAAKYKSDIQISRLEAFKTKISALNSLIGGITAKYNMYQAQWSGEAVKADVYKTKLTGYSERLKGIQLVKGIDIENAKIQLSINELKAGNYKNKLEGLKAVISAKTIKNQSLLQEYTAELQGFEAELKSLATQATAKIESYKAKSLHESNLVNLHLKQADLAINHADRIYGLQIEQYKTGASIGSQIAASALSAVSASASYGYDEGVRTSYSYDETKSDPEFKFITNL